MGLDEAAFERALDSVRERIARGASRSGRSASAVRLMAVTKTLPFELARLAMRAGVTLFGENRVQEAAAKWSDLPGGIELHLIGHLQRNKAKVAVSTFHTVQSIDKVETARELSRQCAAAGRVCDILFELNTSGEEAKSGVHGEAALRELVELTRGLPGLRLRGLMTVGPLTQEESAIRGAFASLRDALDGLRRDPREAGLDVLSMGMSGDFELAVEEGSTMVRLGTALFGPRQA